jgi:hypothetical protein
MALPIAKPYKARKNRASKKLTPSFGIPKLPRSGSRGGPRVDTRTGGVQAPSGPFKPAAPAAGMRKAMKRDQQMLAIQRQRDIMRRGKK